MYPTLVENDYLIINRMAYKIGEPKDGDIIVFKTNLLQDDGKPKDLVKRVIATEGQHIKIEDSKVYVDDKLLDEPYIQGRLKTMLEAKNLELAGCYHQEPMSYPALLAWCQKQAKEFLPYICDTGNYLDTALSSGKQIVLEAQLALCVILTMAFSPTLPVLQRLRPMGRLEREFLACSLTMWSVC